MLRYVHPVAGVAALALVAVFWVSTVVSELAGGTEAVVVVKRAIPYGLVLLVPALAITGASGVRLARGRRAGLVGAKLRRMPFIALNGLLVLVPAALFLAARAGEGRFDLAFYAVQAVELLAGAINLTLLGLNMRDGLRMTRGRRRLPDRTAADVTPSG